MELLPVAARLGLCGLIAGWLAAQPVRADDWPQWRGSTRDGTWRETGIVTRFEGPELKSLWRAAVGSGFCGPTVAAGRVYLMDRVSGQAGGERTLCFNASTGQSLWTNAYACEYHDVAYDSGPRASVTVEDGRAYALGTMGNLTCLNATNGRVLWSKSLEADYHGRPPQWGIFVRHGQETWLFNERGELIIARLTPQGYREISRARLIEPTTPQTPRQKGVCWTHPAFANRCVYVRNDRELLCVDLALKATPSAQQQHP